jgi:hypothetical protein
MVAIRSQNQEQQYTTSNSRQRATVGERISGQYWRIARQRRALANIVVCFRDQLVMLPLQVEASIERLCSLRRAVQASGRYLQSLHPHDTERLRPYGCIEKLADLEYKLSRAILLLAMFGQVCQAVSHERIELHLTLRYFLPVVLATLDDTTSQLAALMSAERNQRQEAEEAARHEDY